ncbi:MAG: KamA family radical SAM protein [Candidatus Neomarinimicrobiota bacterium]
MQRDHFIKPRDFRSVPLWKNVTAEQWCDPVWQRQNVIRDIAELHQVIRLSDFQQNEIARTIESLRNEGKEPMRISPYYATLISEDPFHPDLLPGEDAVNRLDPIFWQAVPTPAHLLFPKTGSEGAMAEEQRSYGAAYQRYPNRVALFVAENSSCASYCTHCQRAKTLDSTTSIRREDIDKGLFYIDWNKNIDEVLVTGGDALMISMERLEYVLTALSRIKHLRVIRIATRVPVTLPMVVSEEKLTLIDRVTASGDKYVYFMTHINHYHEITPEFIAAIRRIHSHGYSVRNQTVLLKHVNDNLCTLAETFRRMLWAGVEPYYLLQCHREKGLVHFITPIQIGKILIKNLQGWLSGMARPVYAANVECGGGKVILMPSGHDTMNVGFNLENRLSESFATINTWDDRIIDDYEALGRALLEEYEAAIRIMDKFIGRSGVFQPSLIITDTEGNHIETTNKSPLPQYSNAEKADLLDYSVTAENVPLTNPALIEKKLDELFANSKR